MARNLLTDKEFRNAKPLPDKDYRMRDGDGLFVFVAKTGGKSFQYRYKLNGKGQTATLKGVATLAEARDDAERMRKMVAAGDHPKVIKQVARAAKIAANAQTFKVVAAAWVKSEARRKRWWRTTSLRSSRACAIISPTWMHCRSRGSSRA